MDANSSICLSRIANGELEEKFQHELARVLQNLMDVNTPFKDKRKITIDMIFEQNEERREIQISLAVKSKLAPRVPVKTHFGTGRDLKTGKLYIEEFLEVEQPESQFIFRAKDADEDVAFALFEADGGAWEITAMRSIKEYLENALADISIPDTYFTIIS